MPDLRTPFTFEPVAHIRTDLTSKFGLPRQSGLVPELSGRIEFVPAFRQPEAIRELDTFSHIWLLWVFSEAVREGWSATVRPPRLGGNQSVGVFASRSPFRPNAIGLSCVKLEDIEVDGTRGPVISISGVDLMDGTPILDIKPYVPYADAIPDAAAGFTATARPVLSVADPHGLLGVIDPDKVAALRGVLAQDPRPSYQRDSDRVYGFPFAGWNIRFRVKGNVANVVDVVRLD